MNDIGWKEIEPQIDGNDEFISELAQDIQREILHVHDRTLSNTIDMHLLPPDKPTFSGDPLFYISCPDIKPIQSTSLSPTTAVHAPPMLRMRVHKSAEPIRLPPLKPPVLIRYPKVQSPIVRHAIAFPKDKRKPVLCSPYYAPQYIQPRRLTPAFKSVDVPDFLGLDSFEFGDIETKGGPTHAHQKRKRSEKKKANKRTLKQTIVSDVRIRAKTMPQMQPMKSKLRVYKKRDKCPSISNHIEHQNDDRYVISPDDSSNESLYFFEGIQPTNINQAENSSKGMQNKVENKGNEGQEGVTEPPK
eukprot:493810_1